MLRILLILIFIGTRLSGEETLEPAVHLGIKPFLKVPLFGFNISPRLDDEDSGQADESAVDFQPNVTPVFGVGILYRGVQFSVSAPLEMDEEEIKSKGKTRYNDMDFQYMQKHWGLDLGWYRYVGFYKDEDAEKAVYLQHSDMKREGRYVNLFFMPLYESLKFSDFSGAVPANAKGDEFSWTPLLQISYEDALLHSTSPFISNTDLSLFKEDVDLTEADIVSLGVGAGALGSYQFETMRMWMAMSLGVASQNSRLKYSDGSEKTGRSKVSGMNISLRIGMDHDWEEWKMGMSMIMDMREYKLENSDLSTDVGSVTIFGVRKLDI
jgi:hypothetical protein